MPELYFYTTPPATSVSLTLDSGVTVTGIPGTYHGRADGHLLNIPPGTPGQGSTLKITCAGYQTREDRGIYTPGADPNAPATFMLDDIHLSPEAVAPPQPEPQPPPVNNDDPESIINGVWATGQHELKTKEGCGKFTEACCTALHDENNSMWGHIKKNPGQNQWNGHAVDAVQCLAGEFNGIWDIIHDSESPNASPAFNHKGPADPALWYYPAGAQAQRAQAQDATTATRKPAAKRAPAKRGPAKRKGR